jgi:hypothetical protein
MKKYLQPSIELLEFYVQDVLTVSDADNLDVGGDWNDSWDRREL